MSQERRNQRPMRGPMGGGPPGMRPGEKPKDFKGTIKKLLAAMSQYKIQIGLVVVFALASTVFSIVGPKIMGRATTALFEGFTLKMTGAGGIDFEKIAGILLTLLGLYGISAVCAFVQGWLMSGISQRTVLRFRRDISEKVNRMPLGYFESHQVGDTLSRVTNDCDTLTQSLNQSVTTLITSVTAILGAIVMMLTINVWMTLIAMVILPVAMLLISFVVKRSQKYFVQQQASLAEINGQVEETYSGYDVVKVFGKETDALVDFMVTNKQLYQSAWKSQFISGMMMPIMNFVGNAGYVAVALLGGLFAFRGIIAVGDIQAFIQYLNQFTRQITQVTQVSNMLQSMAAAAERVFAFLDEAEEAQTAENPVSNQGIQGSVTFEHVKFGYDPEKIIINDFSAEVEPGQTIAIVGPTGAGKTTMVKLLMRFYDVNSGRILIDGHDIRDFDRADLRALFGMVLQDTWLFKGTIMENIRYGRLDASDDEVIAAAKAAHVHHFVQTLPGGYQMELNEDASNVSQGQKQLLTIARAILADKKLLILDEATSSVDTSTESRIQRGMRNLMRGRTSFVIAHRLSTIRDADLILVMRDGDIVEQGKHQELLDKGGFYAELYNAQFEDVAA